MNAKTQEGSLRDVCSEIHFVHPDGTLGQIRAVAGAPSASCELPGGSVIFGCRTALSRRPPAQIQKKMRRHHQLKRATEPVALASAGYVWRNPPTLETAAQLIAHAGLRGKRVRNIEISAKCPNFIVSRGSATASDVLALMDITRERVAVRSNVMLESEIRMLGVDAATSG